MSSLCLRHATLIRQPQPVEDIAVLIEDGKIVQFGMGDDEFSAETTLDCSGLLLVPGFIDLQCNGAFGHDFTHDPSSISPVAAQLPRFGVTSFLPTIITSPLETIVEAQRSLNHASRITHQGATPIGLHIEGPFLNVAKKGAHNPGHLRSPDLDAVREWRPETGIRLVTLAPELSGATELISYLSNQQVVVSAGHSTATFAEATAGFDAGISYGTHLFNAMPPLHHREPGLPAALLADARATIGLIPDGVHVHPELIGLVWRMAGGRINVVTDAMAAMGSEPGVYQLGDHEVTVDETSARLADGTLAGSTVTLDRAVRNLREWTGCSIADAIDTVTRIPADLLNLPNKGRISTGCDADLVLLTPDLHIHTTIVDGYIAYSG